MPRGVNSEFVRFERDVSAKPWAAPQASHHRQTRLQLQGSPRQDACYLISSWSALRPPAIDDFNQGLINAHWQAYWYQGLQLQVERYYLPRHAWLNLIEFTEREKRRLRNVPADKASSHRIADEHGELHVQRARHLNDMLTSLWKTTSATKR